MATAVDFELASGFVAKAKAGEFDPSNDTKLKLYGYYKQSNEGDCTTQSPGILKPRENAKWKAWNELKGMDKAAAQELYVKTLTEAKPDWRP